MVVGLLPTAVFAADDVEINEANFPDANFWRYVQTEFDTDENDRLSSAEIAAVKQIIASTKGIKNLKGIEFFTALETLNCVQCELTELDVSKNSKLARIDCGKNGLTSLNLDQNEKIEYVNLNDYQFANKGTLPAGVF